MRFFSHSAVRLVIYAVPEANWYVQEVTSV